MADTPSSDALYLSQRPLIEEVIGFVCRRRSLRGEHAEDFAGHVRLKLVESDYDVLRKFQGRSSLKTYLAVVIERLALDYQAARWGKWRPSAAAKRGGQAAVRLEQLTVRDGRPLQDGLAVVVREFGADADAAALERLAARFPIRTRRHFVGDELLENMAADSPDAEALLVRDEEQARFARVTARLRELMSELDPQQRLILQMRFEQGLSVADIARLLALDQKRLYRTIDQALAGLRRLLEAEGVSAEGVAGMSPGPGGPEAAPRVRLSEGKTP
jgi:RNA polymerase sigma factor for flagellar operon FliA